jgi:hypothetical protein
MQGALKRWKLRSYEAKKIGIDVALLYFPLFLASALPIFTAMMPEDERGASGGKSSRQTNCRKRRIIG